MDGRSGDAHDEELLALLRGVSNKSASASRFDDSDDATPQDDPRSSPARDAQEPTKAPSPVSPRKLAIANNVKNQKSEKPLPPWKRRGNAKLAVSPAHPKAPSPPIVQKEPVRPSTFTGERGGDAHDEELLALLRGVSNKTASSSRFDSMDNEETTAEPSQEEAMDSHPTAGKAQQVVAEPTPVAQKPLPPWKTKRRPPTSKQTDGDVVVMAPTQKQDSLETASRPLPPWKQKRQPATPQDEGVQNNDAMVPQYGIKSDVPSTFSGERGGAAEDAELLALLRGVSKQSASSRFDDEETAVVAPYDEPTADHMKQPETVREPMGGVKSNAVTVKEPRGQATKSPLQRNEESRKSPNDSSSGDSSERKKRFPPWKRNKTKTTPSNAVVEDVESIPNHLDEEVDIPQGYGIKNEIPSTFSGERGGSAEDPELLALLRGVSKASATSRYDEDADGPQNPVPNKESKPTPPWKKSTPPAVPAPPAPTTEPLIQPQYGIKNEIPSTFSGERGGAAEDAELLALLRGVSKASASSRYDEDTNNTERKETRGPSAKTQPRLSKSPPKSTAFQPKQEFGINNPTPSQFKGERGGTAEDPELLALLRGVSVQADSGRFNDDPVSSTPAIDSVNTTPRLAMEPIKPNKSTVPHGMPSGTQPQKSATSDEIQVAEEDIPGALLDKNWKIRCEAYTQLELTLQRKTFKTKVIEDSSVIMDGLDEAILSFGLENNASALDKALGFLLSYAEHCKKAGEADYAANIVLSLLEKNAFSSRPTTLKLASSLTLKLMEVGLEGASSVHAIVEVLLEKGIGSKKPKVVQAAAELLLEASLSFGASSLPLASLKARLPKCLEHTNAKVRDTSLKVVAEICRLLGSKNALDDVVAVMKTSQLKELDAMLASQPEASPVGIGLRHNKMKEDATAEEALAVLEAGGKALEAQRYAARPAIDLISELRKTDFKELLEMPKWSQKVTALSKVIECAGEKPYKLARPSSSRIFAELVSDIKKQLTHTHFAVSSKAMEVLSVLAEGAGDGVYANLKPLLPLLFQLTKDKKLTNAVLGCLDSMYGNVLSLEHILDPDGLPPAVDEKKQKNALARSTCMLFLQRCIDRKEAAGPRGGLSIEASAAAATLCAKQLEDSDASVRKNALQALTSLHHTGNAQIDLQVHSVVQSLKSSNPRAYKKLAAVEEANNDNPRDPSSKDPPVKAKTKGNGSPAKSERDFPSARLPPKAKTSAALTDKTPVHSSKALASSACLTPLHLEDALVHASGLQIPNWNIGDEEVGVLDGLKATKWMLRRDAINRLTFYINSGHLDAVAKDPVASVCALVVVVKEQTRGFRETNVNIMKAILEFLLGIMEFCESRELLLHTWASADVIKLCVERISDRKLSETCKKSLSSVCVVSEPSETILLALQHLLKSVKSPVAHEEVLNWLQVFCDEFGAFAIGPKIGDVVPLLFEEMSSSNIKVKKAAVAAFGQLHTQMGPGFKALCISLAKSASLKDALLQCFETYPFDASSRDIVRDKSSLANKLARPSLSGSANCFEVPKTDLCDALANDILPRLNAKEGKASWKQRKGALDEIAASLHNVGGSIETSPKPLKFLADLVRSLRDRLSDTQINLRPLAAKLIGDLLSLLDKCHQAKLGKLAFPALISSAMNDIKKPVRESSLSSINAGLLVSTEDGNEINQASAEVFINALSSEVNEASIRAVGLPDVLNIAATIAGDLPCLEEVAAARGATLGGNFAMIVVDCLHSSKNETRSAASALMEACLASGCISPDSFRKTLGRLKPALQRSIGPLIEKHLKNAMPSEKAGNCKNKNEAVRGTEPVTAKPKQNRLAAESTGLTILSSSNTGLSDQVSDGACHPLLLTTSMRIPESQPPWPEYPDEPNTESLETLRNAWKASLPLAAASKLFPSAGMKKQDDAKDGCDLLKQAIAWDIDNHERIVIAYLGFILRWICFVLYTRESAHGLNSILSTIQDLLSYLGERHYKLSDSEMVIIVPLLLEKASMTKERFEPLYNEILQRCRDETMISAKDFGTLACSIVIERSSHAKAKNLACEIAKECVSAIGLSAIGKRGLVATAKFLSEDPARNRSAALDLLVEIATKMKNDVSRLSKICGGNLSDKGRQKLEERMKGTQDPGKHQMSDHLTTTTKEGVATELPRLLLRHTSPTRKPPPAKTEDHDGAPEELFVFTTKLSSDSGDHQSTKRESNPAPPGTSSAAASLRARLMKIREKGIVGSSAEQTILPPVSEKHPTAVEVSEPNEGSSQIEPIDVYIDRFRSLLKNNSPLDESDEGVELAITGLRIFHIVLAGKDGSLFQISRQEASRFRLEIIKNANTSIDLVRRMIGFSFSFGHEATNGGIMIPLASICLATLMAIFRDTSVSAKVSVEELTLLFRDISTVLLDQRLSSGEIDEEAGSQMVRAINKLAVQAATGSERHKSFLALFALQQQLSSNSEDDPQLILRLSRVVSKLLAKVVREEEASEQPFDRRNLDMDSLLCAMEDTLIGHEEADKNSTSLVKTILMSILESYGNLTRLFDQLKDLDIDPVDSELGKLASECAVELNFTVTALEVNTSVRPTTLTSQPKTPSKDVAVLVSRLGSASSGTDREDALNAIRRFTDANGEEDLEAHLKQLSGPFREFIENQLAPGGDAVPAIKGSVSERIENLRSRLQVSQSFGQQTRATQPQPNTPLVATPTKSGLAKPTPSKLATTPPKRDTEPTRRPDLVPPSLGSAAALRARLAAVRQQNKS